MAVTIKNIMQNNTILIVMVIESRILGFYFKIFGEQYNFIFEGAAIFFAENKTFLNRFGMLGIFLKIEFGKEGVKHISN